MAITLVTGTPGAGKTLYAVKMLVDDLAPSGRPIYADINGLDVPFDNVHAIDPTVPKTWHMGDYPDGSIFIFDEVQQSYPPRNSQSKVPPFVAAFETHRHRGFDFVFITQAPRLLDRHLTELIGRHIHLWRPFNWKQARVLEWQAVNMTPQPPMSRSNALANTFQFPKKYFRFYKSASMHTMKMIIPWKVVFMIGGLVIVGVFAFWNLQANFLSEMRNQAATEALPCTLTALRRDGSFIWVGDGTREAKFPLYALSQSPTGLSIKTTEGVLHVCTGTAQAAPAA
jgi:zona occludens toxin